MMPTTGTSILIQLVQQAHQLARALFKRITDCVHRSDPFSCLYQLKVCVKYTFRAVSDIRLELGMATETFSSVGNQQPLVYPGHTAGPCSIASHTWRIHV